MSARMHAETKPAAATFTPVTSGQARLLQRKCACGGSAGLTGQCAECDRERLTRRRHYANQTEPLTVPPIVYEVLRLPGQPLDAATRAFMESRFGHDFSHVRVHTDAKAAESARAVNALAYTVGRNIVFGPAQYQSGTIEGGGLIAHELAHTLQQSSQGAGGLANLKIDPPGGAPDREADSLASQVMSGKNSESAHYHSIPRLKPHPISLQRRAEANPSGSQTDKGNSDENDPCFDKCGQEYDRCFATAGSESDVKKCLGKFKRCRELCFKHHT